MASGASAAAAVSSRLPGLAGWRLVLAAAALRGRLVRFAALGLPSASEVRSESTAAPEGLDPPGPDSMAPAPKGKDSEPALA